MPLLTAGMIASTGSAIQTLKGFGLVKRAGNAFKNWASKGFSLRGDGNGLSLTGKGVNFKLGKSVAPNPAASSSYAFDGSYITYALGALGVYMLLKK